MRRLSMVFTMPVVAVSLLMISTGATQDAKKDKDAKAGKLKGMLPQGFKDLGLSKSQVEQIYKLQMDYGAKIKEMQSKIDELKKQRTQEEFKVLTADQKKKYLESKGVDTKKPADKKDADKK